MIQRRYTRAARKEYSEVRRKEKRIHKKKKKEYYEKQLEWIQDYNARKESRKFYKQVNRTREGFQGRALSYSYKEVEILTNNVDVLKRWKEYFQNLYGEREDRAELQTLILVEASEDKDIPTPTLEEVKYSIQKQNNNRAPGPDGLNAELLKIEENKLTGNYGK
jgi:hypothetical protein